MNFIPIEQFSEGMENKYMAVLVAAREARRLNEMRRMGRVDVDVKPIQMALERIRDKKVVYQHHE
jgi:DNA-directed RNA polymerase omega subunit